MVAVREAVRELEGVEVTEPDEEEEAVFELEELEDEEDDGVDVLGEGGSRGREKECGGLRVGACK